MRRLLCAAVWVTWLTGCGSHAAPDYCLLNHGQLRPLIVGENWQPEVGELDENHSNCSTLEQQPELAWQITQGNSVTVNPHGLEGVAAGGFKAEALDDHGRRRLNAEGFVLPEVWQLRVDLEEQITLPLGSSRTVDMGVVDAAGTPIPGAWIFLSAKDISVVQTRGCLPWRETHACEITAAALGGTTLRIGIGGQRRRVAVDVVEAP